MRGLEVSWDEVGRNENALIAHGKILSLFQGLLRAGCFHAIRGLEAEPGRCGAQGDPAAVCVGGSAAGPQPPG